MSMEDRHYVGTELKIVLNIELEGFDMDENEWKATVKRGSRSIVCDKTTNTVRQEDGTWILLVDSSKLGAGLLTLITEADVPDEDFEDGLRHEVNKIELMRVESV